MVSGWCFKGVGEESLLEVHPGTAGDLLEGYRSEDRAPQRGQLETNEEGLPIEIKQPGAPAAST
jgi:hypothetical protein